MEAPLVVFDAAAALGLPRREPGRAPGATQAPDALRRAGLLEALNAQDGGVIEAPKATLGRDAQGVLDGDAVRAYGAAIAAALAPPLAAGALPVLLGGDCSIVLGARRALPDAGLAWVDGHRDLNLPEHTRHGGAAGMALSLVLGALDGGVEGLAPGRLWLFGHRDDDAFYPEGMLEWARGAAALDVGLEEARIGDFDRRLATIEAFARECGRFWMHLDVDVIDDAQVYAVDARAPGGMSLPECMRVLRSAGATGRLAGLSMAGYDPELDPSGACARRIVATLAAGLRASRAPVAAPVP